MSGGLETSRVPTFIKFCHGAYLMIDIIALLQLFYRGVLDAPDVMDLVDTADAVEDRTVVLRALSILAGLRPGKALRRDQLSALIDALQIDSEYLSELLRRMSARQRLGSTVKSAIHAAFTAAQLSRLFTVLCEIEPGDVPQSVETWFQYCAKHQFSGADVEPYFAAFITPINGVLHEVSPASLRLAELGIPKGETVQAVAQAPKRRRL